MSKDQPNNPLHGITLEAIVEDLVARRGWADLASRIRIRCFAFDPSVRSSLKFLRKTEWARKKVEQLYLYDHRTDDDGADGRASGENNRDLPGVESLGPEADCPPGEGFWKGTYTYLERGCQKRAPVYFWFGKAREPSSDQLAFARLILSDIDGYIAGAIEFLRAHLQQSPELFGLDSNQAKPILQRADGLLPFGVPEPSFYSDEEWTIRFAECGIRSCEELGVMVLFRGTVPTAVDNLRESETL